MNKQHSQSSVEVVIINLSKSRIKGGNAKLARIIFFDADIKKYE